MASAAEVEAVYLEPKDDDLVDKDRGVDATPASSRAPLPKLKSAIIGGASSSAFAKKTKGSGFHDHHPDVPDRSTRLAASKFDSLRSPEGPSPQRWIFNDIEKRDIDLRKRADKIELVLSNRNEEFLNKELVLVVCEAEIRCWCYVYLSCLYIGDVTT